MSDSEDKELEETQKKQKEVGAAESNPQTTGPAEKLREKAAEAVDEETIIAENGRHRISAEDLPEDLIHSDHP
jgi:hypothetical protein